MSAQFSALFSHDYYTPGCVIVAFLLLCSSPRFMKPMFLVLFLEFLACNVAFIVGVYLTKLLANAGLFFVYFIIQLSIIYIYIKMVCRGYRISFFIAFLIGLAGIFNIFMIAPYYNYTVFGYNGEQMRIIYPNLLGVIMLLQLMYMLSYNKLILSAQGKYGRTYTSYIDDLYLCYNKRSGDSLV